jgi:hypothetical protein
VQEFNGEEKILENECQLYCVANTRKIDATASSPSFYSEKNMMEWINKGKSTQA